MPNRKCADRNSPAANEVPAAPGGTPPGQPPAAPENAASTASTASRQNKNRSLRDGLRSFLNHRCNLISYGDDYFIGNDLATEVPRFSASSSTCQRLCCKNTKYSSNRQISNSLAFCLMQTGAVGIGHLQENLPYDIILRSPQLNRPKLIFLWIAF